MVTTLKAWVGAVISGLTLFITDVTTDNGVGHITSGEWASIAVAVLATGAGVYIAPRTTNRGNTATGTTNPPQ